MENHPIPQDVTGFQFKLIGNLTVKQFAYVATGAVSAAILWQLPVSVLIKFPFCAFFAIFGAGLAYFPVSGRPMDLMIVNYLKALFRPTQFIYKKNGGQIYFPNKMTFPAMATVKQYKNDFHPFPQDKLKNYLQSLDAQPKNKIDEKENNFLVSLHSTVGNLSPAPKTDTNVYILRPTPQPNAFKYSDSAEPLKDIPIQKPTPLSTVEEKTINQPKPAQPPTQSANLPKDIPTVIRMSKGSGRNIVLPNIPDSINIITGITKDPRGNALSGIMIEVKDKDGNPVRAFKTNELGRFASATPLTNGTYTVEFEDPKAQNKFEKMIINVAGQIILPMEATSIDTREELRRSLFNTN